ncbi:uncharacterized protein LOC111383889 [Olea europaea var. sylvestris]|uniref:uncharacterized protein LOC111383889 n=1 Tax=Olea europaea var. sylvestris TaxID=158386 RepID=UPI000C1D38EB|nr:uncharacterized protein LOC111383889 [Olea europaea var. sylvestris]
MRQRRWLELVKDYNCTILYHQGKANVDADALSRMNMEQLSALCTRQDHLIRDFENLIIEIRVEVGTEKRKGFEIAKDRALMLKGRLCVPKDEALRNEIMTEAHSAPYVAHPGGTKMYRDLRNTFWWRNMKGKIALFVSKYMVFQQVKAEHQRPYGLLNPMDIPEWK